MTHTFSDVDTKHPERFLNESIVKIPKRFPISSYCIFYSKYHNTNMPVPTYKNHENSKSICNKTCEYISNKNQPNWTRNNILSGSKMDNSTSVIWQIFRDGFISLFNIQRLKNTNQSRGPLLLVGFNEFRNH